MLTNKSDLRLYDLKFWKTAFELSTLTWMSVENGRRVKRVHVY